MDRDHFIITVYCLVCEHYHAILKDMPLRQAGFAPALTDEEVLTIEICGEYFKCGTDKDIFHYFQAHYLDRFPQLRDRTLFVRQAANLWWIKMAIQRRLTQISRQAEDPVQTIDTLPLPVCVYTRSRRDRCFKPEADYGYCAAKDLHTMGSSWVCEPHGPAWLSSIRYSLRAPTIFNAWRQAVLEERRGIVIVTPKRKGMKKSLHSEALVKVCRRLRKCVKTVGSHLTERFAVARIRAHDLWHYHQRLIRKVLAHTIGVFLNLQLHRAPLDLDGLLSA